MAYYTLFRKLRCKTPFATDKKTKGKGRVEMKKPSAEKGKYIFLKGVNPARFLLALYILIPLLIIGSGFGLWIEVTPSFYESISNSFVSDRLLDTSALADVTAFRPYKLFYTGPVDGGEIQSNYVVDTEITLKTQNLYTLAKESENIMYLNLILSLTDGSESEIFGKEVEGVWRTHFSSKFETVTAEGLTISYATDKITTSSYRFSLKLDFSSMTDEAFVDNTKITPSFILDSEGYPLLFDMIKDNSDLTFRLDLKLTEIIEE